MTKRFWGAAFVLLFSSISGLDACAAEKLAAQMQAGEHRLILNGSGVRTKLLLELYVAGLYLTHSNNNAATIIAADEPMAIRIKITSGFVSQSSLVDSLEDGFQTATGGDTRKIRPEIDQFREYFKDAITKNDVFDMIYVPQQGVIVSKNGELKGTVTGVNFKQALFGIWLSDKPVDNALKQALLTPAKVQ